MQKSQFFNSIGGDRKYKAEEWAEYFASFIGNGVFANPSTSLLVQTNVDTTVVIRAGKAWINGYFYMNTSNYVLQMPTADPVLRRIDRIVVRWSLTTRDMLIFVKQGTAASTPQPPPLQRDYDVFELALADVTINAGATQITAVNITDLRWNTELCGAVAGVVQQIDATFITAQFDAFFAEYKQRILDEYGGYMENINIQFADYVARINERFGQLNDLITLLSANAQTDYDAFLAWIEDFKTQITGDFSTWFAVTSNQWTTEFITWFDSIKGMLEGDIATTFANDILKLQTDLAALETSINDALTGQIEPLTNRITAIEDFINTNLTFSTEAFLGYAYLGTAYLSDSLS